MTILDEYDVKQMTNRDLSMSLRFAVLAPADPEALIVIKEAITRLKRIPDEDSQK